MDLIAIKKKSVPGALGALLAVLAAFFGAAPPALAHEAYVLPASEFSAGLQIFAVHPFAPLLDAAHWKSFLLISVAVAASYLLMLFWATTGTAARADALIRRAAPVGPLIIRAAVSASFFYSALSNVVLGPELPLSALPFAAALRFVLILLGLMIMTGTLTELAGAASLGLFALLCWRFGWYMATYTNYLGEFVVLAFFGSRFLSVDRWLFGNERWWKKVAARRYLETPLVRVLYGVALIYAGYTIKFAHQQLTVDVYNQYHLVDFFHASASFIAAGAGLAEIMIGVFVLLGFAMRWTVVVSLAFITLSILYFKELLWPHFILYGISFSLLINSADCYTIDSRLVPWFRRVIRRQR